MFETLPPKTQCAVWWIIIVYGVIFIISLIMIGESFLSQDPDFFFLGLLAIIKAVVCFSVVSFIIEEKREFLGKIILGIIVAIEILPIISPHFFISEIVSYFSKEIFGMPFMWLIIDLPPFLLLLFSMRSSYESKYKIK